MFIFLFWLSLFAILYAYIGYTILLLLISIFRKNRINKIEIDELPYVSLIISAYNEEKVIAEKIENSLQLDYPKHILEIIVISDGSDDRTEEIVKQYTERGVTLKSYLGRIGKSACLNYVVPHVKGDVIVFSDANSKYDRNAIRELVKHFSDEKIGLVTGHTKYVSEAKNVLPLGVYSRLEMLTKRLESNINSCVGADGAIFAMRKKLYLPLNNYDINDFVIPLEVIRQGYKTVFEANAFCIEEQAKSAMGEYDRQVRISSRTIRALFSSADLLNPFRYGLFAFQLFSHKILKYLSPFFILTLFVSSTVLINQELIYFLALTCQLFVFLFAVYGYFGQNRSKMQKIILFSQIFIVTNVAMFVGWIMYFKGNTFTTWTKVR